MKSYQNTAIKKCYKRTKISENVLDNLMSKNIVKRLQFEETLDKTHENSIKESTFDKLLKTKCFNPVIVRNFPVNNVFSSSEDSSSLLDKIQQNSLFEVENDGMSADKIEYMSGLKLSPRCEVTESRMSPLNSSNHRTRMSYRKQSLVKNLSKSLADQTREDEAEPAVVNLNSSTDSDGVIESSFVGNDRVAMKFMRSWRVHQKPNGNIDILKKDSCVQLEENRISNIVTSTPVRMSENPTENSAELKDKSYKIIEDWSSACPNSIDWSQDKNRMISTPVRVNFKRGRRKSVEIKNLVVNLERLSEKRLSEKKSVLPEIETENCSSQSPKVHLTRLDLSEHSQSENYDGSLFKHITRRRKRKHSNENRKSCMLPESEKNCSFQKSLKVHLTRLNIDDHLRNENYNDSTIKHITREKRRFYENVGNSRNSNEGAIEFQDSNIVDRGNSNEFSPKKLSVVLTRLNLENSLNSSQKLEISLDESSNFKKYNSLTPGKHYRKSLLRFKKSKERKTGIRNDFRRTFKFVPLDEDEDVSNLTELNRTILNCTGYLSKSQQRHSCGALEDIEASLKSFSIANESEGAREIVLRKCNQAEPLYFAECYNEKILRNCQKIGEGVYGEVFLFRDTPNSTTVMKIIPIEGEIVVNLEKQKTFQEILPEIVISTELSALRNNKKCYTDGFVNVKNVRCVQGKYPDRLLELWDLYQENKRSENDCPDVFQEDQLYLVLELENAGIDLEAYQFQNANQALAAFKQIACALAVAETALHFEHRDLHWGNILISNTEEKRSVYVLDGKEILVENQKIKATIIDYTLSRIESDGIVVFYDLSTEDDLFNAEGDYQFEVYRRMREKNGNNWKEFEPYTNILWLHYILDKANKGFRYKNAKAKVHKTALKKLGNYLREILNYDSVTEFVLENF